MRAERAEHERREAAAADQAKATAKTVAAAAAARAQKNVNDAVAVHSSVEEILHTQATKLQARVLHLFPPPSSRMGLFGRTAEAISAVGMLMCAWQASGDAMMAKGLHTAAFRLYEKAQMLCPFDMHLAALVYQVSAVAVLACSHRAVAALC